MFLLPRAFPLFVLAFVAAAANLSLASNAIARDHQQIWKVPVFYVTDRQPQKNTFGPRRILEKNTVSRLDSGIVEVSVQQDENKTLADWQKTALLKKGNAMEPPKVRAFKCQAAIDLNDEFDAALKDALQRSSKKEVFVFVHGFNNSFVVAADNAARLAFYTGCPVILYSWPSAGKLYRYSLDECNNEWSQEHFDQFLEHLIYLKKAQGLQMSMVA